MAIRGRPFERGNKFGRGRPRGSRNQISQEARELLLTFKGTVVRKSVLEAAKKDNGDNRLLAKLLDHILNGERTTHQHRKTTDRHRGRYQLLLCQDYATGRRWKDRRGGSCGVGRDARKPQKDDRDRGTGPEGASPGGKG
jgi:hypothetical protein